MSPSQEEPIDLDQLFQQRLLATITERFPTVQVTVHENTIQLAPYELTLVTKVLDRTRHPNAFTCTLGVRLAHPVYFSPYLEEFLAGIGEDEQSAVANGAAVFANGVLHTVFEGLSASHNPGLDILTPSGEPAWHPIIGPLQVQGTWATHSDQLDAEHLFNLLRPALLAHLSPQPFHWLKVYSSRQPSGEYIGDCRLDNQPWPEGLVFLQNEAANWPHKGQFAGQKQFILLRKCGLL